MTLLLPTTRRAAGPTDRTTRRIPRRFRVVAVLAVLAFLGADVAPTVYGYLTDGSAKDRIAADPPPPLFPTAETQQVDTLVDPAAARADALMARWWHDHGTGQDDAAFAAWVQSVFPPPPSTAARAGELAQLDRLDAQRTDAGVAAATWLEAYGKKDVWKLEAHDQGEYLAASRADDVKTAEDDLLSMAKDLADGLATRYPVSAPYVLEPSLRTDKTEVAGETCPCSYPSRHAAAAAASRTYLAGLQPQRDGDYRWWQDQIDYSRLYMAGHVPSDVAGGTLLGDLVGEYFRVTRGNLSPAQARLAPGA